jgi:hypothetical protein
MTPLKTDMPDQGIDADSVPESASLLPLSRTHSAGCASTARWCQRFAIDRDTRTGILCAKQSFVPARKHSSRLIVILSLISR